MVGDKMDGYALLLENDHEIVEEYVGSGSERAANSLVRKYRSFVYATALRYLREHEEADDCAQEVFIKALSNLKKFRKESNLKTWLYKITVNQAINKIRKKKMISFFSLGSSDESFELRSDILDPEENMVNSQFMEKFNEAFVQLPEKQRETFALRYFDELKYEEISEMLGTSVGGLKANYYQAVKKLAHILKDEVPHA